MSGETFLFTVFALMTCLSAIAIVVSQTVVRMAFWLVILWAARPLCSFWRMRTSLVQLSC